MTSTDTANLLDDAANRIADISRADLQIMLRRAALRLRNAAAVSSRGLHKGLRQRQELLLFCICELAPHFTMMRISLDRVKSNKKVQASE